MKRWRVLLLSLWGNGCRITSKMVAQSYSQGINQQRRTRDFRFSDRLPRYGQSLKYARRVALMDATRQTFQISEFHDTSFFFIPGMFRRNLTEIGQIYIPDKFAKVDVFLPKSNARFLAHKDS